MTWCYRMRGCFSAVPGRLRPMLLHGEPLHVRWIAGTAQPGGRTKLPPSDPSRTRTKSPNSPPKTRKSHENDTRKRPLMCGIRLWYTLRRCGKSDTLVCISAFPVIGAMSEVDTRDDIPTRTGFLAARCVRIWSLNDLSVYGEPVAFIDSISWSEQEKDDIFAWKYPKKNLSTYTQLVVAESQEAVLFPRGE